MSSENSFCIADVRSTTAGVMHLFWYLIVFVGSFVLVNVSVCVNKQNYVCIQLKIHCSSCLHLCKRIYDKILVIWNSCLVHVSPVNSLRYYE